MKQTEIRNAKDRCGLRNSAKNSRRNSVLWIDQNGMFSTRRAEEISLFDRKVKS